MNSKDHQMILLTEAIDRHVVQIQELQADNERFRAALRFIDDEAHDLNAAEECAREALAAVEDKK